CPHLDVAHASLSPAEHAPILLKRGNCRLYNREAARYARWAAWTAALIALIVAGVYGGRVVREARARRHAPAPVPASVQQQSAQISFSKVDRTALSSPSAPLTPPSIRRETVRY